MGVIRVIFVLSLICLSIISNAQTKDTIIDGKPFVIHTVEPRETLYGISRLYNAELNDLVISNPVVIQGLQIGYKLLVPLRKSHSEKIESVLVPPLKEDTFRSNRITEDFFTTDTDVYDSNAIYISPYVDTSLLRVAVILPFYLDLNDSLKSNNGKHIVYPKSETALDFYFGFKLAVDSLESLGYNIDLKTYDAPNDSVFESILNQNLLYDREYIFGPIYIRQFEELAKYYGYDKNKKLISPLSYKSVQGNYHNVFQTVPLSEVQLDTLIENLLLKYRNDQIIILGHSNEENLYSYSKKKLSKFILQKRCEPFMISEEQLEDRDFLKAKLRVDRNVLLIPSNNRSFVSRLLPMLGSMQDTSFTVYGLDSWNRFNNLDFDDLEKLNVHMPRNFSYQNSELYSTFTRKFYDSYYSYPKKYAFSAYQQALYFLSNDFQKLMFFSSFNNSNLKSNFRFDITQFENYQQILAN
jgi:hypothetical protein